MPCSPVFSYTQANIMQWRWCQASRWLALLLIQACCGCSVPCIPCVSACLHCGLLCAGELGLPVCLSAVTAATQMRPEVVPQWCGLTVVTSGEVCLLCLSRSSVLARVVSLSAWWCSLLACRTHLALVLACAAFLLAGVAQGVTVSRYQASLGGTLLLVVCTHLGSGSSCNTLHF